MALTKTETGAKGKGIRGSTRIMQGGQEFVTYPENSSFRLWYSDVAWRYETHVHTAVEIVLTTEGVVEYTVEDRKYEVMKNQILIIPPNIPHETEMKDGSSRKLFLFEPEALLAMRDISDMNAYFSRTFYLHDGSETQSQVRELLMHAAEVYQQQGLMWNTVCHSDMMQIFALLGQEYLGSSRATQAQRINSREAEMFTATIAYINAHYRDHLTLDDVAEFAGFSRYYFSRVFRKQTGSSFKDYLIQKRLQVATDLLIRTNASMREVAEESGFGSVVTFNRIFRESKNCTPSQFRAIYGEC